MRILIRSIVSICALTAIFALAGCGKSAPPIEGRYKTNDGNYQMEVQTTSLMTVWVIGHARRATFEQHGDDLTIRSDGREHPGFEFTAKVIKDGSAVKWLTFKNLDTGTTSPWNHVVLSHVAR